MNVSNIIDSYAARRVTLLEDSDSALLGQKNDGTSTRSKITHLQKGGLEVIGMVHAVSYGFWNQRTALMLAMRISFKIKPPHQRIKYTEISVSFEPHKNGIKSKNEPVVHKLFHHNPNADDGIYHLKAQVFSSKKSSEMNTATWTINESRASPGRIPDDLYLAMIVECIEPFQATVEVEAKSDVGKGLKWSNWPWSKDDALLFDLQTERGPQLSKRSFDNLTSEERSAIFRAERETSKTPPLPPESESQSRTINRVTGQVLRIQGIPFAWDCASFAKSFAAAAGLSTDCILLSSFADNPHRHEKTAVIAIVNPVSTNESLPKIENLSIKLNSGSVAVRDAETQNDIVLSMDSDFIGFTALGKLVETRPQGVDIIAVSGLGGHAYGSFKERGGSYMWIQDSLPNDLTHWMNNSGLDATWSLRVLSYGYDSHLGNSDSFQNIEDLANRFRHAIRAVRQGEFSQRSMIFIGHSLGGLLIKSAIIQMSCDTRDKTNTDNILGCLFFGVPNRGMDISSLIPIVGQNPNRELLNDIGKDSEFLIKQSRDFREALPSRRTKVYSFYETMRSPTAIEVGDGWKMQGPPAVLVDKKSATHGRAWEDGDAFIVALNRTHSGLVKFGRHDQDYEIVMTHVTTLMQGIKDERPSDELLR